VGRAAAHPGHAADQVEQVPAVGRRHRAGQLDDRARRDLGERGRQPAERARPGHAEDITRRDEVHQRLAGGLAEPSPQRLLVVVGEVEHERVLEAERRAQFGRQARVQVSAGQADLDAHHPRGPRGVEQPGDPEPADAEPVRDVDLGDALQVKLPRYPRGQDNFGRPVRRQAGHKTPPSCAHLSALISYLQLFLTLPSREFTVMASTSEQ
jgi:hypothetical protein